MGKKGKFTYAITSKETASTTARIVTLGNIVKNARVGILEHGPLA